MGIDVWSAIYLGTIADLDTNEGTLAGEGESALLTTYGSYAAPVSDNIVDLTTNSADTVMTRDNAGSSDTLSFETSPGGPTATTTIDSIYEVIVEFTFADNGTFTLSGAAKVVQDTDGNLFLVVEDFVGGFFPKIFNDQIVSLSIESINDDAVPSLDQGSYGQQNFNSTSSGPSICFLAGTRLRTPCGEVAVEDLQVGDFVDTLDHGPQEVLWIGRRVMNFPAKASKFKPYRIRAGALGGGMPRRDLKVSRQHRMLVDGPMGEVLVPAAGLETCTGVAQLHGRRQAEFLTILLPRHALVFAEGALAESFYPGPVGLGLLPPADRDRLCTLFPGLAQDTEAAYGPHARPVLSRAEAVQMMGGGAAGKPRLAPMCKASIPALMG